MLKGWDASLRVGIMAGFPTLSDIFARLAAMLYNRRRLLLTPPERQAMREACRFNAQLMDEVRAFIRPGVTTGQVDKLVETYTREHGHAAAPLGYHGQAASYPASCCTSVNDV